MNKHRTRLGALLLFYSLLLAGLSGMLLDGLSGVALITYYVGMPFGAWLLWRYWSFAGRSLGISLSPTHFPSLVWGTLTAAALVWLLFEGMRGADWMETTRTDRTWFRVVAVVAVQQMVVAALEEFTFRGVIQNLLMAQVGRWQGLLGGAVLFGLFHIPNILNHEVPTSLLPLTVFNLTLMGLVFGYAFYVTNDHLALPFALHFGWNTACFALERAFTMHYMGPRGLIGVQAWFPESGLLGTAALLILGAVIWGVARRKQFLKRGAHVRSTPAA